jgi:hypothetical protein
MAYELAGALSEQTILALRQGSGFIRFDKLNPAVTFLQGGTSKITNKPQTTL